MLLKKHDFSWHDRLLSNEYQTVEEKKRKIDSDLLSGKSHNMGKKESNERACACSSATTDMRGLGKRQPRTKGERENLRKKCSRRLSRIEMEQRKNSTYS